MWSRFPLMRSSDTGKRAAELGVVVGVCERAAARGGGPCGVDGLADGVGVVVGALEAALLLFERLYGSPLGGE